MNHMGTGETCTNRLLPRKFKYGDEQRMLGNFCGDELVTAHVNWHTHKDIADTRKFLYMHFDEYDQCPDFYG